MTSQPPAQVASSDEGLQYIQYSPEKESECLSVIRELISSDLSEPYSIYVYRYFLYQWGELCYMVRLHFVLDPSRGAQKPPSLHNHFVGLMWL